MSGRADQHSKLELISTFLVWNSGHSDIHEGSLNIIFFPGLYPRVALKRTFFLV